MQGGPLPGSAGREGFLGEVEALRAELAASDEFHPGVAISAAHAAIRAHIPFLARDRALDGEVATICWLVESGEVLAAARSALSQVQEPANG